MGDVQSSCFGGNGPVGMNAVGVVVAEGTAAGGFSVRGLTDELEAAELEVAVPEELVGAEEEALLALDMELLAMEAEEASWAATAANAGNSAASVLKARRRMLKGWDPLLGRGLKMTEVQLEHGRWLKLALYKVHAQLVHEAGRRRSEGKSSRHELKRLCHHTGSAPRGQRSGSLRKGAMAVPSKRGQRHCLVGKT